MGDPAPLLRDLLRFDTSNPGSTEEEAARYVVDALARAGVDSEVLEPEPGRCTVVSRVRGSEPGLSALVVHAHLDVVPAQDEGWLHDPFGGEEADGFLWGRGAVDMKNVAAMMLAAQTDGLRPRRDLVFCYFADEEMGGGAGSRWAVENRPDVFAGATEAIGETGGFTVTLPDGRRLYPIQTAERGFFWVRIAARGPGGHAAISRAPNPTVRLARVIDRVAALSTDDPPPEAFAVLVKRLAEALGGSADDPEALLAPLGSFGVMALQSRRTTFVPTVMSSRGIKVNVIPDYAEVYVDCRFVPGGADAVLPAIESALDEPDVSYEVVNATPGVVAPTAGPLFQACAAALREADPEAIVVPFVLAGGTDAQQLAKLGIAGYGFTPLELPPGFDYSSLFHAANERVPVEGLRRGYEIFRRFVETY